MFTRNLIFAAFHLLFVFSLAANSNNIEIDSDLVETSIKKHANHFLIDKRLNSVSIGVVKSGQIYKKHFGELTPNMGNTPNDNTFYEIGSVSKTMTGLLIAKAVKEGKLKLETNIVKYLSEPLSQLSPSNNPVTIKQLLTHTSGIPRGTEELNINKKDLSRKTFMLALNTVDTSKSKHQFTYSSAGVELLAYILETVYQTPFDQLLQSVLKQQANMTNTKVNLTKKELNNFAYGYNDQQQLMTAHTKKEILWGSSGFIKSTLTDLTHYMQMQLDKNNTIVELSQQKLFHVSGSDSMSYLWVAVDNAETETHFVHHGGVESTQNWIMVFPEYNIGISVITNSSFPQVAGKLKELALKIIDDIKPFGKKSIYLSLSTICQDNINTCLSSYQQLKTDSYNAYFFEKPSELNLLGYSLINSKHIKNAIEIFTLLTVEFPENSNAYDSLGEAYFIDKNFSLSIRSFKKSLSLNPSNTNAEKMLQKLKEKT